MIVKEADPVRNKGIRAQSGAKAEKDMAFYLRRAFSDRSDVYVFHDLRLVHDGEVAQIDHLILHRHGIFIVESKSVTGEMHITAGGQFTRHYGRGRTKGMASPVQQAQMQASILRKLLIAHKTELREKSLLGLIQGGFKHCPIEVRVAVSDQGIIRGEEHALEVRKADLIPQEIEDRINAHREGGKLLNLNTNTDDGLYRFRDVELERVRDFLLKSHMPKSGQATNEGERASNWSNTRNADASTSPFSKPPSKSSKATIAKAQTPTAELETGPLPQFVCSKCQSLNLRILHGKYGYYFKCDDCAGNTRIDTRIDGTERQGRIRKSGREFFLVDTETGKAQLVFVNPKATQK